MLKNFARGACTNHVDKREGEGGAQMTTTLNNRYLVIGGGGSKLPKILSTRFVQAP